MSLHSPLNIFSIFFLKIYCKPIDASQSAKFYHLSVVFLLVLFKIRISICCTLRVPFLFQMANCSIEAFCSLLQERNILGTKGPRKMGVLIPYVDESMSPISVFGAY